jgi:ubiquinone biosynthesis protein COQ9
MSNQSNYLAFLNALSQGAPVSQALQAVQEPDKAPVSLSDVIHGLSHYFDELMLARLTAESMPEKIRERIGRAVFVRLSVMEPYKASIATLTRQGLWPHHGASMIHTAWQTADQIWYWAGDEATDFNHYTKRTLLLAVMAPSMATWLGDVTEDHGKTKDTIEKAVARVMEIPKLKEKALTCLKSAPLIGRFF